MTIQSKGVFEYVQEEIRRIASWIVRQRKNLREKEVEDFAKEILKDPPRIFVTGAGRSGKVAEAFGMRLVHLGYEARILGEITAPPIEKDNLFIVISGSGTHRISETKIAKERGAKIIVITSHEESELAQLADKIVKVPGRKKEDILGSSYEERRMRGEPVFPLGTAFESFSNIFLDAIISYLITERKKTEEDLEKRHA